MVDIVLGITFSYRPIPIKKRDFTRNSTIIGADISPLSDVGKLKVHYVVLRKKLNVFHDKKINKLSTKGQNVKRFQYILLQI